MGKRLTEQAEERIRDLAARGLSARQIAAKVGTTARTVQRVLERQTREPDVDLPSRDDKRLSDAEVARRVRYSRDLLVEALEVGAHRVATNLRAGRAAKDAAAATATAADKLRSLDAYLSLAEGMTKSIPKTQAKKEAAYVRLLWTQAASGNMPAAKLLAKAWGIERIADPRGLVVTWEDGDATADADDS